MMLRILEGYCPTEPSELADQSVQCVVTSPPYFGLRTYGTEPQLWSAGRRAIPSRAEPVVCRTNPQAVCDHAESFACGGW